MISKRKAIQYYQLARHVADIFSKDPSTKVGAIFIAPESYQVLSIGYNGMPRGIDEKDPSRWERPGKYEMVEHAERNCIYNAVRHGSPLNNSIAIVTLFPCCDCSRGIIQAGIKTLVTTKTEDAAKRWGEAWIRSEEMLREAGVDIILLTTEEIEKKIDVTINMPESSVSQASK